MAVRLTLSSIIFAVLFWFGHISYLYGQTREFEVCKVGATKAQDHICLNLNNCPAALAGLKKGVPPTLCGYNKNVPLACCAPNVTTPPIQRTAISIVNEMCNKYKEAQYRLEEREGLFPGDPPHTVKLPDCVQQETLIVGGKPALPKEFPHMALLGYNDSGWKCAGTLISERYVLTAAHCMFYNGGAPKQVRLGELNYAIDTDNAKPQDFNIVQIFTHPNYSHPVVYDDIALLKLDRDVEFNAYIRPICLDALTKMVDSQSIASGWGTVGPGMPLSDELMKVTLPFVPVNVCQKFFQTDAKYRNGILETTQLCAGDRKGGKDTCLGDSGGPLQIYVGLEPCMYVQLGITSFGSQYCGEADQPAVYTKVSAYLDWIQRIVWPQ